PLKPQRVYAELRKALPPDAVVTLDAGAAPAYGYDRPAFAPRRTFRTPPPRSPRAPDAPPPRRRRDAGRGRAPRLWLRPPRLRAAPHLPHPAGPRRPRLPRPRGPRGRARR